MIRFIKGKFHPQMDNTCIVETSSGLGLLVHLPGNSPLYRNVDGEDVRVYTYMIVREDDLSLYGFDTMDDMRLFAQLITVNGVGAKAAMAVMSILPGNELRRAIASGDAKMISQANGVGKKTSERIILELKDKVGDFDFPAEEENFSQNSAAAGARSEAVTALLSLGYSRGEAEDAVSHVRDEDLSAEEYIRLALKSLF